MHLSSNCFDKSADLLSKYQNKWKITPNFCGLLRKAELYLVNVKTMRKIAQICGLLRKAELYRNIRVRIRLKILKVLELT